MLQPTEQSPITDYSWWGLFKKKKKVYMIMGYSFGEQQDLYVGTEILFFCLLETLSSVKTSRPNLFSFSFLPFLMLSWQPFVFLNTMGFDCLTMVKEILNWRVVAQLKLFDYRNCSTVSSGGKSVQSLTDC